MIITKQCEEIKSILSRILSMHLNINQSLIFNTSSVIMSLQRVEINTLSNRTIQLNDNAQIKLPSTMNLNIDNSSSVVIRVKLSYVKYIFCRNIILVCSNTISYG